MYPSDLKDVEWEKLKTYFERSDPRGARSKHEKKRIVEAILYVTKSGCQWRMLPKDFPPWKTVYDHFRLWNLRGVWEKALDELNSLVRQRAGRKETPSYAIIDSQSVKTQYASKDRGIHGGKKDQRTKPAYQR
jgi:putative transposase